VVQVLKSWPARRELRLMSRPSGVSFLSDVAPAFSPFNVLTFV
jgi:hypothetical protein